MEASTRHHITLYNDSLSTRGVNECRIQHLIAHNMNELPCPHCDLRINDTCVMNIYNLKVK